MSEVRAALSAAKYISLTTYRKDGTPVATPVWVATLDDHFYVITGSASGKVKRIRNNPRVKIAVCDARGRITGPGAEATASLLDTDGTKMVERLVSQKYRLTYTLMNLAGKFRLRKTSASQSQGLKLTLGHANSS
jgi:PPOX class probable F420-dependent enzyme